MNDDGLGAPRGAILGLPIAVFLWMVIITLTRIIGG